MFPDDLQKELYKAVDKRKTNGNYSNLLKEIDTVTEQSALQRDEVRDEILKEFAEKFIREHPDISEGLAKCTSELAEQIVKMVDFFGKFIGTAVQTLTDSYIFVTEQSLIENYPNKRLVHLALYGRTERIRKKNRDRILKEIKKNLY